MKSIVCIFSLLFLFLLPKNFGRKNDTENLGQYRIVKLDSIKNVYLIYAKKNDSIFKVISSKSKEFHCNSLKVNNSYKLNLKSWFLPEESNVKMRLTGIKYEGVVIDIERQNNIVEDLFTCQDLKGLCYIEKK